MVRLALADVALATMGHLGFIAEAQINGEDRQPCGNYLYGAYGKDFVTADGRRVMIVGLTGNQWNAIKKATGLAGACEQLAARLAMDLEQEGNRFRAREELTALFAPWFAARTLAEVASSLDAAGVCWGKYQTIKELVDQDPECSTANPLFEEVEHPGIGTYLTPGNPLYFATGDRQPVRPAPLVGQHTDEILADELGMSSAEIGRLHDANIVAGAE